MDELEYFTIRVFDSARNIIKDSDGPWIFDPGHQINLDQPPTPEPSEPDGYRLIGHPNIYSNGHEVIILGMPAEDSDHNCDVMGCSSVDHVIYRGPLKEPE